MLAQLYPMELMYLSDLPQPRLLYPMWHQTYGFHLKSGNSQNMYLAFSGLKARQKFLPNCPVLSICPNYYRLSQSSCRLRIIHDIGTSIYMNLYVPLSMSS